MSDGSSAVSLTAVPAEAAASATAAYARMYKEQQPRLVAYARSLTRNAWAAEDLVAEAHFRVWRRLAAGHEIDNVPAYLMTTVRHLATAAGTTVRETPRDPHGDEQVHVPAQGDDPAERVSSVDLVVRVLEQLPERWVKALWLSEAEGQPLAAIAPQLGAKEGATAVLLHRAREGMRQAFLRAQTGAPDDPACQVHWARMPAYVRGAATARQSERLLGHVDACDDCRARLAALMSANDRLPALIGPALLVFAVGGLGKYLLTFATGSAGAATALGGAAGHGGGLLHGVRHAAIGGSKAPVAVAAGTVVAAATALCLVLGSGGSAHVPAQRVPVADTPPRKVPVAEAPVGAPSKSVRVKSAEGEGTSARTAVGADESHGAVTTVSEPRGSDTDTPAEGGETGDGHSKGTPAPDGQSPEQPGDSAPGTPSEPTPEENYPTPPTTGGSEGGGAQPGDSQPGGSEPTPENPEQPADPPPPTQQDPQAPPAPDDNTPTTPTPPTDQTPEPPTPPTDDTPETPAPPTEQTPAPGDTEPTPPAPDESDPTPPAPPAQDPSPTPTDPGGDCGGHSEGGAQPHH
jgi:RNA polymerase sigma factor (sigma-70 family)